MVKPKKPPKKKTKTPPPTPTPPKQIRFLKNGVRVV